MKKTVNVGILMFIIVFLLCSCTGYTVDTNACEYNGTPYVTVNDNVPEFADDEITTIGFENYSELDYLNRCGVAMACIGTEIMPTEKRGPIGKIKPSGWQYAKYDFVDGKYLYNRCHLIGYQLSGENANERNLITGTRYMNVEGMLPFENEVADYVHRTENHVMYRVTPVFEGKNLVASGVKIEALSVEDNGKGVSFNVYVYNIQPGVEIDYSDGSNKLADSSKTEDDENKKTVQDTQKGDYVINTNTKRFHRPNCPSAEDIIPKNKEVFSGNRKYLTQNGFYPCGNCKP